MSWLRRARAFLPQEISGPLVALYERVAVPGLVGFHRGVASEVAAALDTGRVLDVGTGPGHLLVEVARRNPRLELVGVDLSRRMLEVAESVMHREAEAQAAGGTSGQAPEPGEVGACLRATRLARADVRELPFSDGAFDLVLSTLSLHHWRDPAEGIRECLRVTAPGGQCWIYDLRTDVAARVHAGAVAGQGVWRLILGWIFKFHGVHPQEFAASSVARWLGDGADVRTELGVVHLKLNIRKAPHRPSEDAARPVRSFAFSGARSASLVRPADAPI